MVFHRALNEVFRSWTHVAVLGALQHTSIGYSGNLVAHELPRNFAPWNQMIDIPRRVSMTFRTNPSLTAKTGNEIRCLMAKGQAIHISR